MFVRRAYACPVCGEGFAKWSICQNHVNTSVTCCAILGDRLKIQEELQELCRGAVNGDFIHLAAPETQVEVPVEVPVLPVAPAPLPLTTLVPAPVPMPVGPVRPVSENAGFQWQASSEKLLYSRSTKPQLTNEVNFDDWMPPNLDDHVTLRLHHALQTGYLSKEEQQPLWKSLQQLVDHQPEEQRLVIQKFLGPTYDDFREIVNKPMWLLRCIEHCRRSSARSERVTATVNNERLWAALDGHGLGESDLTEECWNTFGLFPPPLQETVLEAVRQSLLLKTEKNPSRFFTELCVNEEAVYNLEARRRDADEAVQVQPAQGTWESFSDSRYHELLRQLLLNTRNAEQQVLQVLSEDLPGSSGLLQVHLATQDARREGSAELLSLLHAAAANGLARLCARLIAEGFDVNERTGHQLFSPLHLAASNGVLAATELLLAKGAQAWLLDDSGKTPLYHVVTTLPEAKASEQQLLLRIAQQLVLGMLQASEMDELLVESALEILQQSELTWLLQLHHRLRNLQRKNQQIFTPPKLVELGRMRYETLNMLLGFFDGPEKCRLTVPDEALALEFSAVMSSEFIQEQEQLRKKVNVMAKVLDLSRPLIAMLSALPFKAAEHAMNCFQIEERAPCVYAALLPDNDKEESDPGEEVRTLNLSSDVKRTVGILQKWESERGFGFIHDENDTSDPPLDIFVHRTNLMGCAPGYPVDLQEGRRICYIPGFQDGRTRAMSAAMIDEDFNVDPVHLRRPRKAKAAEQSKERKIAKLKEAIEREEHPLSKSFMQFLATAEMQEVIQEKRQEGEAWLRCLGLLRQPPGGKRDEILWRKEIDRRVDIFLDLKTSPLTKKDIDYRCKRILTEFCMRSSAVRVSEALAMVEKSTSGKRREEVRSWPAYVATLLRRFDPEMTAQMEKKPKEKAEPKKEKETNESPGREEEKDSGSSSEPPEASTAPTGAAAFAFQ